MRIFSILFGYGNTNLESKDGIGEVTKGTGIRLGYQEKRWLVFGGTFYSSEVIDMLGF